MHVRGSRQRRPRAGICGSSRQGGGRPSEGVCGRRGHRWHRWSDGCAGALVDGKTWQRAGRLGIDLNAALKQNDTYRALKRLGSHIITGPTGTNVNDLYLLFVL